MMGLRCLDVWLKLYGGELGVEGGGLAEHEGDVF